MELDRKNIIISGIAIALALLVIIFVVYISYSGDDSTCMLLDEAPASKGKTKLVASSDFKALARLDAYLLMSYYNGEKGARSNKYISLSAKTITVLTEDNVTGQKGTILLIDSNCATLKLRLTATGKKVEYAGLVLVKPHPDITSDLSECKLPDRMLIFEGGKHYSCDKEEKYPCFNTVYNMQTSLYVYSLEFEVDGDPVKYENLEFTTPADDCNVS